MLMFALFPILESHKGFIPIAGYNHGAQKSLIKYAALLASLILFYTLLCNAYCIRFTTDPKVIAETPDALRCICSFPLLPSINRAHFQAAGNAKKALLLTLSKQGFFNSISTPTT
jgi:Na+-driven multidrug efflux pump